MRTTIVTGLVPTARTHLGGMSRINPFDSNPTFLGFVEREAVELGKRPTVQLALVGYILVPLATAHPGRVSHIGEVLKDDGTASRDVLDDAFGENMIAIPVESLLLLAQLLQVSLGRLCSFGLQLATEAKIPAVNLFPVLASQELAHAGDSRAIQPQVYPDDFLSLGDDRLRNRDDDMQPPCATAVDEIGCGNLVACQLRTERRYGEGDRQFASTTRESDRLHIPVQTVGMNIVADRTERTLWYLDRLKLRNRLTTLLRLGNLLLVVCCVSFLPREGALKRLSGFDAGLNEQVAH